MKRCPQKCDTKSKANIKQILNSVKLLKKYINSASVAYISAYIQIAELPAAQAVKTKRDLCRYLEWWSNTAELWKERDR